MKASPEQRLFVAIVLQAVRDCLDCKCHGLKNPAFFQAQAEHWVFGNTKDFLFVCQHAGLNPSEIQRKVRKLKADEEFVLLRQHRRV